MGRAGELGTLRASAAVFIIALAVRLLYVGVMPPRTAPDSAEYLRLADNLAAHGTFSLSASAPYTPSVRRAPAYPFFLVLFGGAPRAAQSVLDALVAAMICGLAATAVRLRWAVLAGLLYALHPGAIVYANTILSETLFAFFLTAAIALLVVAVRRNALWWAGAAGVVMAMAALSRAVGAPLAVSIAAVLALSKRVRIAGVFVAATLLALAPWLVRSSLLAGRFVLVTSAGPVNVALATAPGPWNLNDQATIFRSGGAYWEADPCGRSLARARTPRESMQSDDICTHEALANLRLHPGYYARTRVSQLVHFPLTSFDFATGSRSTLGAVIARKEYRGLAVKLSLYALFSFAPLLLGIAGTIFGRRRIESRLAAAVWIFTLLFYAPGFVEYRYFLPAVPMLLVSAAFALDQLLRPSASGARTRPAMPARISNVTT